MATVPTTPMNPALITVLRYVLTGIGGILANRGIISNDLSDTIVGAVIAIVPIVWGAYLSYKNAETMKAAEPFVPDSIISK